MKEELINKILEIIKDYRNDEDVSSRIYDMNYEHINRWINQFDETDQEFILSEFLYLLPNSYLTKEKTFQVLSNFDIYRENFNYNTLQDFFDETIFMDCQEQGKSQKILNDFIDNNLLKHYNTNITNCGTKKVRNWFYVDDVLASGRTFKDDIFNTITEYGINKFVEDDIRIIAPFIILHQWGRDNTKFALEEKLSIKLDGRLFFYCVSFITNKPMINYYNSNPSFNNIFPIKSDLGEDALNFVENCCKRDYPMVKSEYAFRNNAYPIKENFFSSPQNRIRYENILLSKGFEIMKRIDEINVASLRPLGMTPPSYKTLGTGSHTFTWRNISNTCPIVFWWDANDWHPLFARKH
ncbi:phosphoribosyltransferase-like protein [Chryseobacterium defluvii]|nr:hypothetical protein [Chryseobacterium defluvii]